MRGKILVGACCLIVGVAGTVLLMGGTGRVAADCPGPAGEPCGNGDVNGSGDVDIADAVYLLSYLFTSGPEPDEIPCCLPCAPCSLPATGQTTCYMGGDPWDEIDCESAEFPGQDGFYRTGCPMEGRFVDNGDGTVTDNCTGLMWQQATADLNGDGQIIWDDDALVWASALRYCDALILCEDGTWTTEPAEAATHGGIKYDDWRLPNVRELESIVDYGRWDPAMDPVFGAESSWYWSSSSDVGLPSFAWNVDFSPGGLVFGVSKYDRDYVRAVRG